VELLTGQPPYFELDPMPALFRIVQDEHPPLPPGITSVCEEFLLLCFQKDVNLRSSATDLLKHAWIRTRQKTKPEDLQKQVASTAKPGSSVPEEVTNTIRRMGKLEFKKASEKSATIQSAAINTMRLVSSEQVPKAATADYEDDPFANASDDEWNMDDELVPPKKMETMKKAVVDISKFKAESDDESFNLGVSIDLGKINQIKQRAWDATGDDDEEDLDPFSAEMIDESELKVDEEARIADEISLLLESLSVNAADSSKTMKALTSLRNSMETHRKDFNAAINQNSVLPFLEMLTLEEEDMLSAVMRLMFDIMTGNILFMQNLCLAGLVPTVDRLIKEKYTLNIRLEAANLVKEFCIPENKENRQKMFVKRIFVASGGLRSLVSLIDQKNFETYKDLVTLGIECIERVLDAQGNTKADLSRLFCKSNLVKPLMYAMIMLDQDSKSLKSLEYCRRAAHILVQISSTGKAYVRNFMSRNYAVKGMLKMLETKNKDTLVIILKVMSLLSTDMIYQEKLEKHRVIPTLVQLLQGPYSVTRRFNGFSDALGCRSTSLTDHDQFGEGQEPKQARANGSIWHHSYLAKVHPDRS
jgi:hypothetical protein